MGGLLGVGWGVGGGFFGLGGGVGGSLVLHVCGGGFFGLDVGGFVLGPLCWMCRCRSGTVRHRFSASRTAGLAGLGRVGGRGFRRGFRLGGNKSGVLGSARWLERAGLGGWSGASGGDAPRGCPMGVVGSVEECALARAFRLCSVPRVDPEAPVEHARARGELREHDDAGRGGAARKDRLERVRVEPLAHL